MKIYMDECLTKKKHPYSTCGGLGFFFPQAFHVVMGIGTALKTQQAVVYYCVGMLSHKKRIVSSVMGP